MVSGPPSPQADPALLELLVPKVAGRPAAMVALARQFHAAGEVDRAIALATVAHATGSAESTVLAAELLARDVPAWHFGLVRDQTRNDAYEAAIRRAVTPGCLVLEIGTGSGILAMMAARAGAEVVTCEMRPAIAATAREVIAANGLADRITVINRHSTELEIPRDLQRPADVLVSEIVSNDLLSEAVLLAHGDAARRLLRADARVIPQVGRVRVALGFDRGLPNRRMGRVSGFDLSAFNRLAPPCYDLTVDSPQLHVAGEPADLFAIDLTGGAPAQDRRTAIELVAHGGPVNGIVQWLALEMDDIGRYENRPGPGAQSCWGALFWPFATPLETVPGQTVTVGGYHTQERVRAWLEA